MLRVTSVLFLLSGPAAAFTVTVQNTRYSKTSSSTRVYGLFDGVKEAFSAPAVERSVIDSERETPIDRWMGWSTKSEAQTQEESAAVAADFIETMDESNYVVVELAKPMGIVFEENDDADYGGIFVQSLKDDGAASASGKLQVGDQLVAVASQKVCGLPFDDALGAITGTEGDTAKLVLFRGTAKQFYGPTGPSREWLDQFVGVPPPAEAEATEEAASA